MRTCGCPDADSHADCHTDRHANGNPDCDAERDTVCDAVHLLTRGRLVSDQR